MKRVIIMKTHCEVCFMESAKIIKGLRGNIGLSRKEFSEHVGIPVRTLEDWEAGRRTPPEYIPRLIAYQLKYEECELDEESTCRKFRQVRKEGKREVLREIPFYNLDMIISLGYRIKSKIATNFRRWGSVQFRTAIYGIKDIFRRLSDKKRY